LIGGACEEWISAEISENLEMTEPKPSTDPLVITKADPLPKPDRGEAAPSGKTDPKKKPAKRKKR
jgi:hypothetical protein